MARTSSPYIPTFDADMIPKREFLLKTIPYFVNAPKISLTEKNYICEYEEKFMVYMDNPSGVGVWRQLFGARDLG